MLSREIRGQPEIFSVSRVLREGNNARMFPVKCVQFLRLSVLNGGLAKTSACITELKMGKLSK
jgi:hypothetical protein